MDKILFKGINLKVKNKKPRSYALTNPIENYSPDKLFEKEYQNIIHPFIRQKVNCIVQNYLSINRIKDTAVILEFAGYKDILIISENKFDTKYDILDPNSKISYKKYTYVIMDNCFLQCRRPFVVLKQDVVIPSDTLPIIKFKYKHKFFNGTQRKMKHLVIDQLVDDPSSTLIYTTDKRKLTERFDNLKFVDDQDVAKDCKMFNCKRFIFYDLCQNVRDIISRIEWSDNLTLFTIYTPDEKALVGEYIGYIRDMVTIDKEIEEFIKDD